MAENADLVNEYDSILAEDADQSRMAQRSSLFGAMQDNPDEFAQARKLAKKSGLPAEAIRTNKDQVQQDVTLSEYDKLLETHPVLAEQYKNPDFAKLAIDDSENLSPIEQGIRFLKNIGTNTLAGVRSTSQGLWGFGAMTADLVDENLLRPFGVGSGGGPGVLSNPVSRFAWQMSKNEEARAAQLRNYNQPQSTMGRTERSLYSGFESLGSNIVTMPFALGTYKNATEAGLTAGQVAWRTLLPMLPMGAQTAGQEYTKAKDKGLGTNESAAYAIVQGTTELATEVIPVFKFLEDVGAGTPFLKMLAKQIVAENIGEQVATMAQDFTEWRFLQPEKTFADYVNERPSAALDTFIATMATVAGQSSLVRGSEKIASTILESRAKAGQAKAEAAQLGRVLEAAKNSKLRERDPESFAAFVNASAATTGTDINDVYVDARTLVGVLNQAGIDQSAAAQFLPTLDEQLPDALASGGDVRLSVGELLATLPGSAIEKELLPHIRMSPDSLSLAEADVYLQQESKQMQDMADKALATSTADEPFQKSSEAVYQNILGQLTTANRFTGDVNSAYAKLVQNFYATTAKRTGVTPEEMFAQYPLSIQATAPSGAKFGQQDATAQTSTPEFKTWFGDSKVVDDSGTPVVVYHGGNGQDVFGDPYETIDPGISGFSWFTKNTDYASTYAEQKGQGAVYPVFLRMSNPLLLPKFNINGKLDVAKLAEATGLPRDALDDLADSFYSRFIDNPKTYELINDQGFSDLLREQGYDGIVVKEGRAGITYGVLDAGQVKSAIGNSGAFDPNSDNILEQGPNPTSDIGHSREKATGRYVGAPDWIGSSPQQLAVLRKKLRQLTTEGAVGRFWYENSSRAILEMAGGDIVEAEKIVSLIAIYSPNATVPANTSMALTAWYQYKAGLPIDAGFSENDKKAENLLRKGEPWSGIKTNSFYQNLMVEIDPTKLDPGVATMDMWIALAFDYGSKALDQGPKYKFAEREIGAIAAELGWKAHQVQAAVWVGIKGRIDPIRPALKARELELGIGREVIKKVKGKDELVYEILPERRYDHYRLAHKMGMAAAFDTEHTMTSKYDFGDALRQRAAQISWEATPGATTGLVPQLLTSSMQDKIDYLKDVTDVVSPGGKDLIAEAVGLPPGTTITGFSAWQGDIGAGAQTFTPVPMEGTSTKTRAVKAPARDLMNLYASVRGLVLSQEAVVWQVPVYDDAKIRANGFEVVTNNGLSEADMRALYDALHREFGTWELAPGYTASGVRILNFVEGLDNKDFQKRTIKVLESMDERFGGGVVSSKIYRADGNSISNDWVEAPDGEQYAAQIADANARGQGRPDLLKWATDLRARVAEVNSAWEEKLASRPADELAQSGLGDGRGRDPVGSFAPLPGAPVIEGATGPDPRLVGVAQQYARDNGIDLVRQGEYVEVDPARAKRIAAAYEAMPHAPQDPAVKAAYDDLIKQTRAQYDALVAAGYTFTFFDSASDPYEGNPWNAMRDLRANQRMAVYGTYDGYGAEGVAADAVTDNPMLADTGLQWPDQAGVMHPVVANDLFRAVHDAFGHGLEGAGFRARGEENAWQAHVRMFTGAAVGAITSETRGQNSWLNYGPNGEANQTAKVQDTVFAEQKTGLMPAWTWEHGAGAVSLKGVHYSSAQRTELSSGKFGTGYKGAEAKRLQNTDDERLKQRVNFYIDDGKGVRPESGVGYYAHTAQLDNLYDSKADPLGLAAKFAGNDFESAVLDAGFDGYVATFGQGRAAVLLGERTVPVSYAGMGAMPASTLQQGETATRGTYSPAKLRISLLQNADLSTFLHELGHHFLEVLGSLSQQPNASPQIVADFNTVLQWFGVPDAKTWQDMTLEGRRPLHEKFAESYEEYLFEGKAPSTELQGVFNRFRAWMTNVYKSLQEFLRTHKNDLTPEVRQVMDRLIATDEQIAAAENARNMIPLFESAKDAGMTESEWLAYQELGKEATEAATAQLNDRSMADMKYASRAKAAVLRQLQAEMKEKRAVVRAEVEAETKLEPVYQAYNFLSRGELVDVPRNAKQRRVLEAFSGINVKLDTAALKEMYGDGPAAPWRYLPAGRWGVITNTDGIHPDVIAELFGFSSGDELVKTMLSAEKMADLVDARTDVRMLERYGDLSNPDTLNRAADEAIHNNVRIRFVATELRALSRGMNPRIDTGRVDAKGRKITYNPLVQGAKEAAERSIARRRLREIRPGELMAAEERASRKSAEARKANDLPAAITHKRNQLLNLYGAKAAMAAISEVEASINYLRKFSKEGTRKSLDVEYLDQIDAMLERFDLRKGESLKAIDKRSKLKDWITAQEAKGLDPLIDDDLRDEAFRMHFKDMTLEQFRGLVDAVKNIEHLGRLKKKLLTSKDQREFDAVVAEIVNSIHANAKGSVPQPIELTKWDRVKRGVDSFFAMHRKVSSLARQMDGFKEGPLWNAFINPMNEAANNEARMREESSVVLHAIFRPVLTGEKMSAKRSIPEIGTSLSREARLSVALNWGNEDNRQRLMDGFGWDEKQVAAILDTLTQEDWTFVQQTWEHINSYWQRIADKERRVSGVVPERVVAVPFKTKFGEVTGGYYPIKYNPRLSDQAESNEAAEVARNMLKGAYTRATTRRGHTLARAESVKGRPLDLTFNTITGHLSQVTHDLAWHEWLIDANRLMRDAKLSAAIRERHGDIVLSEIRKLLPDIAAGEVPATNAWEKVVGHLRVGATVAALGYNLTTALLQPLGFSQSIVRIGPGWVGKGMVRFLGTPKHMNEVLDEIYLKSDFMRLRGKTMQREINEIRNTIDSKMSVLEGSYFFLIQKLQQVVDVPTWLGAYEKEFAASGDEDRAIAVADQSVVDAQGGGQIKDLARIQRGGPLQKLWTNFYSFFSTTYNLASERTKATDFKNPTEVALLAVDYLLLTIVPATIGTLLKTALRGGDDDDESLVKSLIAENLSYLLGMMIGLREVTFGLQKAFGVNTYRSDYAGPAGIRFLQAFDKLGQELGDGEIDTALLKAANNVGGVVFHYPSGQVNRTVAGAAALYSGDTSNPGVLLVGP